MRDGSQEYTNPTKCKRNLASRTQTRAKQRHYPLEVMPPQQHVFLYEEDTGYSGLCFSSSASLVTIAMVPTSSCLSLTPSS